MVEEEKGFQVKDRRLFNEDGTNREEEEMNPNPQETTQAEAAPQEDPAPEAAPPPPRDQESPGQRGPLPPVEFNGLIISLAHAAMLHLGAMPDPHTGESLQDLDMARHTIDTIAMLKDKTKNNLTDEEQRLIDHTLTELRLAYVQLRK